MPHVFGERTLATLERLLSLLSAFEVVVWMTDGWPLYESRLKGKLHVISKRYTQRIERHNLNLRQHLARLGRKSLSFSKSVELHDKVIGHYLNISSDECCSTNVSARWFYIGNSRYRNVEYSVSGFGNDSNLLIVFYVQIMPDGLVMQLHRF